MSLARPTVNGADAAGDCVRVAVTGRLWSQIRKRTVHSSKWNGGRESVAGDGD